MLCEYLPCVRMYDQSDCHTPETMQGKGLLAADESTGTIAKRVRVRPLIISSVNYNLADTRACIRIPQICYYSSVSAANTK